MKNIILLLLVFLIVSNSVSIAKKAQIPITEKHSLEKFTQFFSKHKDPSIEKMLNVFGNPELGATMIHESIAKQNGNFKPTLNHAAWIYKLKDQNLSILIHVREGKVTSVITTNTKTQKWKIISLEIKKLETK